VSAIEEIENARLTLCIELASSALTNSSRALARIGMSSQALNAADIAAVKAAMKIMPAYFHSG
jgi:hypothetical protein